MSIGKTGHFDYPLKTARSTQIEVVISHLNSFLATR